MLEQHKHSHLTREGERAASPEPKSRSWFRGRERTQLAAYFVGAAYNLIRMSEVDRIAVAGAGPQGGERMDETKETAGSSPALS